MRRSVVCVLLVVLLAVVLFNSDTVQGWGRFRLRFRRIRLGFRRGRAWRTLRKAATAYVLLGRRGAALSGPLTGSDVDKVAEDVTASCPQAATRTKATLMDLFDDLDADGDGTLTGPEVDSFNTFLKTYDACKSP